MSDSEAQLQDELKKAKEQLSSSESLKKKALQEADEAKKQLAAMSSELEETQNQLKELSDSEEARVQELRKVSQDRDKVWQSELEAVQKQQSMDSSALASALNETQKLKLQLDRVTESEASQAREIRRLRDELTEALELVEKLEKELNDSRESECQAIEEAGKALMLLEVVKTTEEALRMEHANANVSLLAEVEDARNKADALEELVRKLKDDLASSENGDEHASDRLKCEADEVRGALEAAERRYQDQYLQSTLQIRDAYELVQHVESESLQRESELVEALNESRVEIEVLKAKLIEKGKDKSESEVEAMQTSMMEKEAHLQSINRENEALKSEILKREKAKDEVDAANAEMEGEMRRLKVQSEQWRKAAEAAAAMLSNGKCVERTGSLGYDTVGGKVGSEEADGESAKKKNGNMLRKIGVLLKKGQHK